MSKIEVISSCLVGTASNDHHNPSSRILELTPWDLRFLQHDPVQKGILFHIPNPSQTSQSQDSHEHIIATTRIHHLKTSLSQTLDFFPPLAGRLSTTTTTTKPDNNDENNAGCYYFVNCNNAGVEFTHAIARRVSVSDILEPAYIPTEELVQSLFPLSGPPNYLGVYKPLLGVQVTELSDGLFIGCAMNHVLADGTSFWHFFNSWSGISRGLTTISKSPVFERWFPSNVPADNRLIRIPPSLVAEQTNLPKPPLLERFFSFSNENVSKLKAKANFDAGNEEIKISSLQALSIHLWRAVTRGRRLTNQIGENEEVNFWMAVGARARIPLPDGYFGNALHCAGFFVSEKELLNNHGLEWAALKLNELVARQTGEVAVKFVENWVEKPEFVRKGTFGFLISSSPRHNVYGCDFGWGKPVGVRSGMGHKFDGKMTFFPGPEPGGIDVEACLAPETMKAMEIDGEFMETVSVSPTI